MKYAQQAFDERLYYIIAQQLWALYKLFQIQKSNEAGMKKQNLVGQNLKGYTFLRVIGQGAWASVYEAIDDKGNDTVAVKVIANKLFRQTPKLQQLVKTEIKVLKSCHNQNVIAFVDSFKNQMNTFIITEFCNGGDLQNYLQKKKSLSEDEATTFLKQILNGFKGLHEVGAMHRDFKVANVLLDNGICKIADLGFAKQMQKKAITKTILGTSLTMAPEVLQQKPYGFQADIWSIGVVYYQLLYGKYPYMGMNDYDILKKIKNNRPDYSKVNLSRDAKDFIDRCLTIDPKKRISWVEIYSHPLIQNKNDAAFIYGTIKSKISLGQNKNFYEKNQLPQKNLYPDLDKNNFDTKGIQFQNVGDIRESSNMAALLQQAAMKKQKQDAFLRYEKSYIARRNDIMFIFKFVSPFVPNFYNIKANHGIALFIMSKKAYIQMKKFYKDLTDKKNIFNLPKHFDSFTNSSSYKNIINQIKGDLEIIQLQCMCYSGDIQHCSKDISSEFDIERVNSKDFGKLVEQTVDSYWFLLAQALDRTKDDKKRDLIRVLQALLYYKSSKVIEAEQFDHMMTVIDFNVAEKQITKKYTSAFS